jgi:hypothetical protein
VDARLASDGSDSRDRAAYASSIRRRTRSVADETTNISIATMNQNVGPTLAAVASPAIVLAFAGG